MSGFRSVAILLLLLGCATTPPLSPRPPLISQDYWPEHKKLPDDPEKMDPPKEIPVGDWVVPIEKDEPAKKAGIVVSEARAWRDGQFRIAYKDLRDVDAADRQVWVTHRAFYEERYAKAQDEIEKLQPTWWDRHAFTVGVVGGLVIGGLITGALAVATVHAITWK